MNQFDIPNSYENEFGNGQNVGSNLTTVCKRVNVDANDQSNKSLSPVKVLSVDSLSPLGEQQSSLGKNMKIQNKNLSI